MKTMTFEQAKQKLARLAKGEYHSMKYGLTVSARDNRKMFPPEAECSVYIHGTNWYVADTWEGAFAKMKAGEERRKKHKADRKEQPL